MDKAKLEQMARYYLVDLEGDQDKLTYNSLQRIQELMWLETNHIDKEELQRQASIPKHERQLNLDLQ